VNKLGNRYTKTHHRLFCSQGLHSMQESVWAGSATGSDLQQVNLVDSVTDSGGWHCMDRIRV